MSYLSLSGAGATRIVGIGLTIVLCGSCTLVFGAKSKDQCNTDADCLAKDPAAFTGTFCSDQKVCVSSLTYCKTNLDCIQRNAGKPYICHKDTNSCVSLFDDAGTCTTILGAAPPYDKSDLANDSAFLVGTMFTTVAGKRLPASQAPLGKSCQNGIELVRQDFHDKVLGINGRPLLFLACNDEVDPMTTAKHLVENVKVPVIVGPMGGRDATVVAPYIVGQGVLNILPVAPSVLLTKSVDRTKLLLYRLNADDALFASAVQQVTSTYLEPLVRSKLKAPDNINNIKVMVAYSDDPQWSSLGQITEQGLTFNGGKTAADQAAATPPLFQDIQYSATDKTSQGAAALTIAQFEPHIILFTTQGEAVPIMAQIEGAWTNTNYRPYYFFEPPVIAVDFTATINAFPAAAQEPLRKRLVGLTFGPSKGDPIFGQYGVRFTGQFAQDVAAGTSTGPNPVGALAFDAAYLLGIAALSVTGDFTPQSLSQAIITKTQPGSGPDEDITKSPTFLQDVQSVIKGGQGVNYNGASGKCNFDKSGDAFTRVQFWCVNPQVDAKPSRILGTGLSLNPDTRQLEGTVNAMGCGF